MLLRWVVFKQSYTWQRFRKVGKSISRFKESVKLLLVSLILKSSRKEDLKNVFEPHQGDCVQLESSQDLFQVIGVDNKHDKCWVRKWPLPAKGSRVIEVSIQQIAKPLSNQEV